MEGWKWKALSSKVPNSRELNSADSGTQTQDLMMWNWERCTKTNDFVTFAQELVLWIFINNIFCLNTGFNIRKQSTRNFKSYFLVKIKRCFKMSSAEIFIQHAKCSSIFLTFLVDGKKFVRKIGKISLKCSTWSQKKPLNMCKMWRFILHMCKISMSLLSIHTFCSIQWFC